VGWDYEPPYRDRLNGSTALVRALEVNVDPRGYAGIVSQLSAARAQRREPRRTSAKDTNVHRGSHVLRRRRSSSAARATRCVDSPSSLAAAMISAIEDICRTGTAHTSGGRNERIFFASAERSGEIEARRANRARLPWMRVGVAFSE